jgi:hypothetical protein
MNKRMITLCFSAHDSARVTLHATQMAQFYYVNLLIECYTIKNG